MHSRSRCSFTAGTVARGPVPRELGTSVSQDRQILTRCDQAIANYRNRRARAPDLDPGQLVDTPVEHAPPVGQDRQILTCSRSGDLELQKLALVPTDLDSLRSGDRNLQTEEAPQRGHLSPHAGHSPPAL